MALESLEKKLQFFVELTETEKARLEKLTGECREVSSGTLLFEEDNAHTDPLFIVSSGRLAASQALADGQRAITRLYFPGDIVGTANVPFRTAPVSVTATTDSEVLVVRREDLQGMFSEHPRIAALFYTFAALESAVLNDRLTMIGRSSGKNRLAALILEVASRLDVTDSDGDHIDMQMTQTDIGDAIGLTNVHVNRLMRELREDGAIDGSASSLRIHDWELLRQIASFANRYDNVDTSWLPAADDGEEKRT